MATRKIVTPSGSAAQSSGEASPKKKVDLPAFVAQLDRATGDGRMGKVKQMLRADRFQLFSEVNDDHVTGVVKSQTDRSLFYACKIDKSGRYMCCTQNLNVCGGLRGRPCKHLLVLMVGLVQAGGADATLLSAWAKNASGKKAALDKDAMSATFIKYKGAEAGEIDWRPTETIPEDYYAL
jgi:hypothetical protein